MGMLPRANRAEASDSAGAPLRSGRRAGAGPSHSPTLAIPTSLTSHNAPQPAPPRPLPRALCSAYMNKTLQTAGAHAAP
ncbi:hypothetical protein JCM9534A_49000 [Catenuloplanes indicus JCM 9534]